MVITVKNGNGKTAVLKNLKLLQKEDQEMEKKRETGNRGNSPFFSAGGRARAGQAGKRNEKKHDRRKNGWRNARKK